MNNDTVGPKSDDDSGAEPERLQHHPTEGPGARKPRGRPLFSEAVEQQSRSPQRRW